MDLVDSGSHLKGKLRIRNLLKRPHQSASSYQTYYFIFIYFYFIILPSFLLYADIFSFINLTNKVQCAPTRERQKNCKTKGGGAKSSVLHVRKVFIRKRHTLTSFLKNPIDMSKKHFLNKFSFLLLMSSYLISVRNCKIHPVHPLTSTRPLSRG
jgi:hypothetical protein